MLFGSGQWSPHVNHFVELKLSIYNLVPQFPKIQKCILDGYSGFFHDRIVTDVKERVSTSFCSSKGAFYHLSQAFSIDHPTLRFLGDVGAVTSSRTRFLLSFQCSGWAWQMLRIETVSSLICFEQFNTASRSNAMFPTADLVHMFSSSMIDLWILYLTIWIQKKQ